MKTTLVFLLLLGPLVAVAQLKKNSYRVHVQFIDGSRVKGTLLALYDSGIRVSTWTKPRVDTIFRIADIKTLSLRRRNAPERGFGLGAAAGAVVGAAFGYMAYQRPDCEGTFICMDFGPGFTALAGACSGAVAGGLIGLVNGSGYRRIDVDGDPQKFEVLRIKLLSGPRSTLEKEP